MIAILFVIILAGYGAVEHGWDGFFIGLVIAILLPQIILFLLNLVTRTKN